MTQPTSNNAILISHVSQVAKAVKPGIFAILQDGTVLEDAEVETTEESIASSLRDITGSLRDIAKSLDARSDYSDQLDRALELWGETNLLLWTLSHRPGGKT